MDIRKLQESLEELVFVGQAQRLGVFRELHKKGDTSDGLAGRMNFDNRTVRVLLEALVEMKYLVKDVEVYHVPVSVYSRLVEERGDNYEGDFWQFLLYLTDPWRTLTYVLKHGKPDVTSYKNFSVNDFIRGMDSPWKKRLAPEIVELCLEHCGNARLVADIGGAPGTIAREFASRRIKTVIYDLPECMEVMRDELSRIDCIEIQVGDATESLPEGIYDIAFLGNICHGQSPEDNAKIIRMCYEHLSENGIIAIFDNIRGKSYLGARLALHMLTQSPKGDIYTREQYFSWLEQAGFKNIGINELSERAWHLIIAEK